MNVKKAVIPAAGFGTRMLPATKVVPKEILPLGDRPAIQYLVDECVASGIEEIIVITSRSKQAIESYFDYAPELEHQMIRAGREKEALYLRELADRAHVACVRQKEMRGLGHAILAARPFLGDEPFAVLLGDDIIKAKKPVTRQLLDAYEELGGTVIGVQEVDPRMITRYDSVKMTPIRDNLYAVEDVKEKPQPHEIYSNYAILGRYILTPEIFPMLEMLPPGHDGEIQLTDSIAALCGRSPVTAVDFEGKRYDTGSMHGYLEAQIELSLDYPYVGAWLKDYLKELVKSFDK